MQHRIGLINFSYIFKHPLQQSKIKIIQSIQNQLITSLYPASFFIHNLELIYLDTFYNLGSWMIRNTGNKPKHEHPKFNMLNYKNAVLQGFNQDKSGIVYMLDSHHFIASTDFSDHQCSNFCIFFHGDRKYHYGKWIDNKPVGLSVFRSHDTLIFANFENGILPQGSKVVMFLEKHNIGVILEVNADNNWRIKQKRQVYCYEQVLQLIKKCNFNQEIHHSLIKFISQSFTSKDIKLRLMDDQHFKFGFENGLAIVFDDDYQVQSVGYHNGKVASSIPYHFQPISQATNKKQPANRSALKVGQVYKRTNLSQLSFVNQLYIDPSQQYFNYFQQSVDEHLLKQILAGFIKVNYEDQSIRSLGKRLHIKIEDESQTTQKKQIIITNQQKLSNEPQKVSSSWLNQSFNLPNKQSNQANEFEKLPEKSRLLYIKNQIYSKPKLKDNFFQLDKQGLQGSYSRIQRSNSKSRLNSKQIVVSSLVIQSKNISEQIKPFNKNNIEQINKNKNNEINSDLIIDKTPQKHVNSSKYIQTDSQTRKSRKKIFGDFFAESSFSPIKNSTKPRIFAQDMPKSSQKLSKKQESIKQHIKSFQGESSPINNISSPYSKHISDQNSNISSVLVSKPIVIQNKTKFQDKSYPQVNSSRIASQDMENLKQFQKDPPKTQSSPSKFKKDNSVYRKNVENGQYAAYIYDAVRTKEQGNLPYIKAANIVNISRSPSKTICHNLSYLPKQRPSLSPLKVIQQSSPERKLKMRNYLNNIKQLEGNNTNVAKKKYSYF